MTCTWLTRPRGEALGYLARSLSGARVLVLVGARVAELARHEIGTQTVLGLEQQGLVQRLDLRPLTPEAVGELAGVVLGEHPSRRLADWLAGRSLGNPLFALSLLQGLIDEGADVSAPDLRSLPHYLSDRIASRCSQLDEPASLTLDLLAAVGERVELADLLRLTGRALEELSGVLDDLPVRVGPAGRGRAAFRPVRRGGRRLMRCVTPCARLRSAGPIRRRSRS